MQMLFGPYFAAFWSKFEKTDQKNIAALVFLKSYWSLAAQIWRYLENSKRNH